MDAGKPHVAPQRDRGRGREREGGKEREGGIIVGDKMRCALVERRLELRDYRFVKSVFPSPTGRCVS